MQELAFAEKRSNTDVTATSEAAADTVVTAPAISTDGSTVVTIEFGTTAFGQTSTTPVNRLVLFEDGVAIGTLWAARSPGTSTGRPGFTCFRRMTPTAGTHVYSVRGWVSSASTWTIAGGVNWPGAGVDKPAYIRIVRLADAPAGPALQLVRSNQQW